MPIQHETIDATVLVAWLETMRNRPTHCERCTSTADRTIVWLIDKVHSEANLLNPREVTVPVDRPHYDGCPTATTDTWDCFCKELDEDRETAEQAIDAYVRAK